MYGINFLLVRIEILAKIVIPLPLATDIKSLLLWGVRMSRKKTRGCVGSWSRAKCDKGCRLMTATSALVQQVDATGPRCVTRSGRCWARSSSKYDKRRTCTSYNGTMDGYFVSLRLFGHTLEKFPHRTRM